MVDALETLCIFRINLMLKTQRNTAQPKKLFMRMMFKEIGLCLNSWTRNAYQWCK